ncbi:extracellular catalytic domain type 1 short-chain-length polyhydroxyalkanoate depolymerase [Paracoccus sp. 22332]|uniref:extracellular catalytic domain type 1 short-chain-length polyhydroxyalkanoate depolymerase n=1 Tax=Paracoccus sp. 22332 TaxID=3453913 RepID=UPI003F875E76
MAGLFQMLVKATRPARKRLRLPAVPALPGMKAPASKRMAAGLARRKTPQSRPPRPAPGSFIADSFACPEGQISYRFYTPAGSAGRRMPLVVMLHGCSQTAADFAAGTGMNRLADELGFLVLYPQQSPKANIGRCWNWHDPQNQARGKGEPAVIAALTRHALRLGRANPSRVYIAGISAGGTAAAIIGAAYPDLFAAVGVHSGVPMGNIRSLRSAVSAMRGKRGPGSTARLPPQLPTIVFHGDSDRVVHPSNAGGFLANLERSRPGPLTCRIASGRTERGREFTQRSYQNRLGRTLLENWTVHGSGHGWSGGRAAGSHTDPAGPDASREMLRFFLARRRGGQGPC